MRLEKFKAHVEKAISDSLTDISVGSGQKISFTGVSMPDAKYGISEEIKAKMTGSSYGIPVRASFETLDEETGEKEKKTVQIFKLPMRTNRGTFIWNGNEVNIKNQYRRRPGVYTYYSQADGGLYSSNFNMSKGRAKFSKKVRVVINPETLKYELRLGGSKFEIYPILRAYGMSDSEISGIMGKDLYDANYIDDYEKVIRKLAKFRTGKEYKNIDDASKDIVSEFSEISFDGGINEYTLGKDFSSINKDFWGKVIVKLRDVAAGKKDPDDPDASYFREYLEPEDNIIEAINSTAASISSKIKQRRGKSNIGRILQNINFDKEVNNLFTTGSLKDIRDQSNPVDWYTGLDSLTIYGPGGISGALSVTEGMRRLQPTLLGFSDPVNTPDDGDKVGVVLYKTTGAVIKDRKPHIKVKDKSGKTVVLPIIDFYHQKIGIGDYSQKGKIDLIFKGSATTGLSTDVKYFIPEEYLFSHTSNLIPMISSTYGVRANVASKQMGQALPLKDAEEAFVQSEYAKNKKAKYLQEGLDMDEYGNVRSVSNGVVDSVSKTSGKITIRMDDGKKVTHDVPTHYPLNSESFSHNNIVVSSGDEVKKGQVIAESIFSRNGGLAIGKNLRTAFLPYKGYNFEDGFVISEGASQKMTSLHMHKFEVSLGGGVRAGKRLYVSVFPNKAALIKLDNYDDSGSLKEGALVSYGAPVILAIENRDLTPQQATIASFNKTMASLIQPKDVSPIYEVEFPSKVVRAYKDNKRIIVMIESEEPMVEGDKIATRYGGKGIVTKIVPDALMPASESGEPVEVLFNPHGLPSRLNSSQIVENALGKVSEKTGKKFFIPGFSKESFIDIAKRELSAAGLSDEETLIDPETGKRLDRVGVGNMYYMKLKHSVRKKLKSGDVGEYDTIFEQPKKTERNTARGIDGLSLYSLLASGARANLADMASVKANRNDEFWRALQMGMPTPSPKDLTTTKYFTSLLTGIGLNVNKTKDFLSIYPATDSDIERRSGGEIREAKFIRSRDLKPEDGGFYDPSITGGARGEKWSHISIGTTIPNPIFEEPIKAVLGLNKDKYTGIMSGKYKVNEAGDIDDDGKYSGGLAIKHMLDIVDVNAEIDSIRIESKRYVDEKNWSGLNQANRKIRILLNAKNLGKPLGSLYTISKIPVLPPRFRQMIMLSDGTIQNPPINELYSAIKLEADGLNTVRDIGIDTEEEVVKRGNSIYKHVSAAFGVSDPVSFALRMRAIDGGILRQISPTDKQMKEGFIGKRMLNKPQSLSGGSTIISDPELPMDEVGVPYEMAKQIMKPFTIRKMVQSGYTPLNAIKEIEGDSQMARIKLEEVVKERPVLVNRHPSLHKFNFMSQWAKIVPGSAIRLNPLVTGGLNADFDGDSMIGDITIACKSMAGVDPSGGVIDHSYSSIDIGDFPRNGIKETKKNKTVYFVPPGIYVPSVSKDGVPELMRVTEYHEHDNCEEYIVKLHNGHTITVSGDHSLTYFNPETAEFDKVSPENASHLVIPRLVKFKSTTGAKFPEVIERGVARSEIISTIGFFCAILRFNPRLRSYSFARHALLEERVDIISKYYGAGIDKGIFVCRFISDWISKYINCSDEPRIPSYILSINDDDRAAFVSGLLQGSSLISKKDGRGDIFECFKVKNYLGDMEILFRSVGIDANTFMQKNQNKRTPVYFTINASTGDMRNFVLDNPGLFSTQFMDRFYKTKISEIPAKCVSSDIMPVPVWISTYIRYTVKDRIDNESFNKMVYNAYKDVPYEKWVESGSEVWNRRVIKFFLDKMSDEEIAGIPENFRRLVYNESIRWELVESVTKTGRKIRMYDLTVEENKNFVDSKGYLVWDTMNIHAPVSDRAVVEAATKLLPSKFLYGPDRHILPMPSNESILGIYMLSKKTLKDSGESYSSLDKAEGDFLSNKLNMNDYIKLNGKKTTLGGEILVSAVKEKFKDKLRASDIDKKYLQSLVTEIYKESPEDAAEALNKLKDIGYKYSYLYGFSISLNDFDAPNDLRSYTKGVMDSLGDDNKNSEKMDIKLRGAETKFHKFFDDNRLMQMSRSGAKGSWSNIAQMLLAPGYMEGAGGMIGENPVKTGYAEGMSPSDYLNTLYAARSGIVSKVRGVAKGGELAKSEVHTAIEIVITEKDCGTINGIYMDRDDKFIVGRFDVRAKEIDEQYLSSHKGKQIKVRSPLTCESIKGLCSICYGINDQGVMPKVGDHVGIDAAQSTTERITQSLLRAFHGGRGAKEKGTTDLAKNLHNLFGKMPKTFSGEAPVSIEPGVVKRINKSPAGGWDIYVDNERYRTSVEVDPIVSVGDSVSRGQKLTTGMENPRSILRTGGLIGARRFITGKMREMYKGTGVDMNPVHFEVVTRGLTEHARVIDPGESQYEYGDIDTIATIEHKIKNGEKVRYEPIMAGADRIPIYRKDFLSQSARREGKRGIIESAASGAKSELHGVNPLNSWMLGEFRPTIGDGGVY